MQAYHLYNYNKHQQSQPELYTQRVQKKVIKQKHTQMTEQTAETTWIQLEKKTLWS